MPQDVLCLRPEADFTRVGVTPPAALTIAYRRPDGSNSAVAEYAVASAIYFLRRLGWGNDEIREANYVPFRGRMLADNLPGLEGLVVGVVGFGTVGYAVAEAFERFGCQILYTDPVERSSEAAGKLGAKAVPLDELLKAADIVTLHVPLLPQTRSMINARQLSMMKHGAVLIQASRGGIVNETALAAHLNSGHLAGAAVDVYTVEPPDTDNPLFVTRGPTSSASWSGAKRRSTACTEGPGGMERVSAAAPAQFAQVADIMERWKRTKGYPPNSWLTMVRRPAVFRAYRDLHTAVMMDDGALPKALKFMIAHAVSDACGDPYTAAHNAENAAHIAGVPLEKVEALPRYDASPLFTPAERAALDAARKPACRNANWGSPSSAPAASARCGPSSRPSIPASSSSPCRTSIPAERKLSPKLQARNSTVETTSRSSSGRRSMPCSSPRPRASIPRRCAARSSSASRCCARSRSAST